MASECNYITLAFMILAVILIVTLPEITRAIPKIRLLFTNNLNFLLLLVITICIVLLDLPSGIMFALWVIYGTYYYQRASFTNIVADNTTSSNGTLLKPLVHSAGDISTSMLKVPKEKGLLEPFTNCKMSNHAAPATDNSNSLPLISTSEPIVKSRSGYDVVGCRMDGMTAAQNTTMFGPPLSSNCYLTEDGVAKSKSGWYPINP